MVLEVLRVVGGHVAYVPSVFGYVVGLLHVLEEYTAEWRHEAFYFHLPHNLALLFVCIIFNIATASASIRLPNRNSIFNGRIKSNLQTILLCIILRKYNAHIILAMKLPTFIKTPLEKYVTLFPAALDRVRREHANRPRVIDCSTTN